MEFVAIILSALRKLECGFDVERVMRIELT